MQLIKGKETFLFCVPTILRRVERFRLLKGKLRILLNGNGGEPCWRFLPNLGNLSWHGDAWAHHHWRPRVLDKVTYDDDVDEEDDDADDDVDVGVAEGVDEEDDDDDLP